MRAFTLSTCSGTMRLPWYSLRAPLFRRKSACSGQDNGHETISAQRRIGRGSTSSALLSNSSGVVQEVE